MPAILHLLGKDAIASADVVVEDVVALDDRDKDGGADGVVHVVVAGPGALDDAHTASLGTRLLPVAGPGVTAGLRDLALVDGLARALRDLRARHGTIAIHAHGAWARSVAAVVGRSVAVAVIVDAGDERPSHRILPLPQRVVFASHGDLDRALDGGLAARVAAIVPPGLDTATPIAVDDAVIVVDPGVHSPHLGAALARRGLGLAAQLTSDSVRRARVVVVGSAAHLGPAVVAAVAAGIPTIALEVPWADDLAGCAAFLPRAHLDLDELFTLAARRRARPRRLPRALGRAARTEALTELYGAVVGPRISLHPPGRRRRR